MMSTTGTAITLDVAAVLVVVVAVYALIFHVYQGSNPSVCDLMVEHLV